MINKRFAGCLAASLFATVVAFGTFLVYGKNFNFQKIVREYSKNNEGSVKSYTPSTRSSTPSTLKTSTCSHPRHFVCPTFIGRIGNNLFQFASGFGIAYSKNITFVVGQKDIINSIFDLKDNEHLLISKDKEMCRHARKRLENKGCAYDLSVVNFEPNVTYRPAYYLQSWKYFDNASTELKTQLVFREFIQTQVQKLFNDILQKYNMKSREEATFVAVHVRRGDMVANTFGYMVATRSYFDQAMLMFKNYSNVIFLICSNDMTWSKANIVGNYKKEFISGNSPEVDMALMASCDHMIMSVGSYGWWAGWLVKGIKVYFKWPAREGSRLRAQFSIDYMDFFYPHWIGL